MGKDLKGKELGTGITQRKDGIYQARYTDRWGKRQSIYDKSPKKLNRELAKAIADNARFQSIKEDVTLDMWYDRWMAVYKDKSVRPNTKREYDHIYRSNISPYLGNRKINSLVKSDVQILIDIAHDQGYEYERKNKIKIILSDMMQRAVEDHLVINNPVSGINLRSKKTFYARSLTGKEYNIFFSYCKNTFYDNLFNVAVNTGLRPGELFALNMDDVDFEKGFISVTKTLVYQKYLTDTKKEFHIEPPKTLQSHRNVPINSVCRRYLEKQFELKEFVSKKSPKQQNDYLFVTKFNTPLNSQILCDAIKVIVNDINSDRPEDEQFEKFSGHTFRHTFATRCFESGVAPKVVQSYLGHASLKMTMDLYTHVTEEKSTTDIEKIVDLKERKIISLNVKNKANAQF